MPLFRDLDEEAQKPLVEKRDSLDTDDTLPYPDAFETHYRSSFASRLYQSQWLRLGLSFVAGIICTFIALEIQIREPVSNHGVITTDNSEISILVPPGDVKVSFEYDDRYPGPPTADSEQEWLNLLPNGLGFVQHDLLEPGIVDIAAFHQLHCLMALRHALYDTWNATEHSHMTPHHVKHCLEYLRQGIMCNADANTERRITFEDGRKFTPGWEEKKCRDYDALKRWAEKWRVWNGKIPSQREEITDPTVINGRVIHY